MKKFILLATMASALAAHATIYTTNWNTGFANGGVVPDNNFSGWSDTRTVSTMPAGTFAGLTVNLQLSGGWNGDLYAYLVHDSGFTVLLETSGAHDVSQVDTRVRRIMDLKCPASGEVGKILFSNIAHLKLTDEIKFVIGTIEDYEWAKQQIAAHKLGSICPLLMSWVHPLRPEQQHKSLKKVPAGQTPISRRDLAEKIIADALPVRFQIQQHKIIWPPEQRGV